jgi:hypothetical protein
MERKTFFFLGVGWDWVHLACWPLFGLLYQSQVIDDECGAASGMRIGRENQSTRRKPATVPLCPPQIPHDLTWAWTQAATVGSRRLTAQAMAWPKEKLVPLHIPHQDMDQSALKRGTDTAFTDNPTNPPPPRPFAYHIPPPVLNNPEVSHSF